MATPLVDTSSLGTSNLKCIHTSLIKAGKEVTGNTFADLKLQAFNTDETKSVTMTLSTQGDTPRLTLTPQGVVLTGTVISGVANPASSTDLAPKGFIDTHSSATTAHGVTGAIVGTGGSQTLDSKTLTNATIRASTNHVSATALKTSNGVVSISASGDPAVKNALVANDANSAKWDVIPYVPIEIAPTNVDVSGDFEFTPGTDPYTILRHAVFNPPVLSTYTIQNPSTTHVDNRDTYQTIITTGKVVITASPTVHLYRPGYDGNPGGSFTLDGAINRGQTTWLKKRNNTEWILMNLY